MKVVGYARTSLTEQVQGTAPPVAEQERRLRDFARRAGLDLVAVHVDTGLDARHGSTLGGLVALLESMDGPWRAVLVTSPCRLVVPCWTTDAREELSQEGKQLVVVGERALAELTARRPALAGAGRAAGPGPRAPGPVAHTADDDAGGGDPGEDEGRGAPSDRGREIAERLLRGREAGARAGKHQSGPAPYGYRRDYEGRKEDGVLLVPEPEEAEVVRVIFQEYLRLKSMKRLIRMLDERGLRTRRGKRWSRAGISWILKNETYVGRVHFGRIRTKGRHASLVSPITFNRVQKLIRENNRRRGEGEEHEPELELALARDAS